MDIINYIKIENFRSIRTAVLEDLNDYAPLVGLNSSGKSNVLRALNLFFNGHVDETRSALDLSLDYSSHAPLRKKKAVSVTVGITLHKEFNVRGVADFEKTNKIKGQIFIRRTWTLALDRVGVVDSFEFGSSADVLTEASVSDTNTLQAYIRAIRFVYVPNHTRPADLIRTELEPAPVSRTRVVV